MKVTPDHWLDKAVRVPYPAGPAMNTRRFLVMHFTSGATALSSIDFWRKPEAKGAEAHLVIDRDGTVLQIRPFNQGTDHAGGRGKSAWTDPNTGITYNGLNSCSIGIEFANAGDSPALARRYTKLPLLRAKHKNGGPIAEWEQYTPEQIRSGLEVAKALVQRYNLDDLIGHEDVSPGRKNDPGPAFPMAQFREACGFPAQIKK